MPVAKNIGRQQVICAYVDIALADMVTAVAQDVLELPAGATVIGGDVVTNTAYDSTSTDVVAVGDALVANRYLAAGTIHALGRVPLVPTGYKTLTKANVRVTWTSGGGVPTVGAFRLRVDYYVDKRSQFSQGQVVGNRTDGTIA